MRGAGVTLWGLFLPNPPSSDPPVQGSTQDLLNLNGAGKGTPRSLYLKGVPGDPNASREEESIFAPKRRTPRKQVY